MGCLKRKTAMFGLLASALAMTGCTQGRVEPWVWTAPHHAAPLPADPPGRAPVADDHDPSVVVFGSPAFIADGSSEDARRDDQMSRRTAEALPNRLGWPQAHRPSLNNTRSFRGSTRAETWVYPSERREYHYHHYTRRRGW